MTKMVSLGRVSFVFVYSYAGLNPLAGEVQSVMHGGCLILSHFAGTT